MSQNLENNLDDFIASNDTFEGTLYDDNPYLLPDVDEVEEAAYILAKYVYYSIQSQQISENMAIELSKTMGNINVTDEDKFSLNKELTKNLVEVVSTNKEVNSLSNYIGYMNASVLDDSQFVNDFSNALTMYGLSYSDGLAEYALSQSQTTLNVNTSMSSSDNNTISRVSSLANVTNIIGSAFTEASKIKSLVGGIIPQSVSTFVNSGFGAVSSILNIQNTIRSQVNTVVALAQNGLGMNIIPSATSLPQTVINQLNTLDRVYSVKGDGVTLIDPGMFKDVYSFLSPALKFVGLDQYVKAAMEAVSSGAEYLNNLPSEALANIPGMELLNNINDALSQTQNAIGNTLNKLNVGGILNNVGVPINDAINMVNNFSFGSSAFGTAKNVLNSAGGASYIQSIISGKISGSGSIYSEIEEGYNIAKGTIDQVQNAVNQTHTIINAAGQTVNSVVNTINGIPNMIENTVNDIGNTVSNLADAWSGICSPAEKVQKIAEIAEQSGIIQGGAEAIQSIDAVFVEPPTAYAAEYPNNKAIVSPGGHINEEDDTKGKERKFYQHPSGSFEEYHPDGTKVNKVYKDGYSIVMGDDWIHVHGSCNVFIDSHINLTCQGNVKAEISGGLRATVKGMVDVHASDKVTVTSIGDMTLGSAGSLTLYGEKGVTILSTDTVGVCGKDLSFAALNSETHKVFGNLCVMSSGNQMFIAGGLYSFM